MSTKLKVVGTDAAVHLLDQLRAEHGPLMLFQSGGCCDGSAPILLKQGELATGADDVMLGEVAGVPVWIDGDQYRRWKEPEFLIDVGDGPAEGFSLSLPDLHLVSRTPEK